MTAASTVLFDEAEPLPPGDAREILRHLYRDAANGTLGGRLAREDLRELYRRALRERRNG